MHGAPHGAVLYVFLIRENQGMAKDYTLNTDIPCIKNFLLYLLIFLFYLYFTVINLMATA